MRDPRTSRRYRTTRTAYIAQHEPGHPCALCGHGIDTTLPGMSPWGPTIEHRWKVHEMQAAAPDWDTCVAWCCDTSLWALSHRQCQARQGAEVTNARKSLQDRRSRW